MTVKELVYLIQKPGFEVADLHKHEVLIIIHVIKECKRFDSESQPISYTARPLMLHLLQFISNIPLRY
jgi:hypothetical protein